MNDNIKTILAAIHDAADDLASFAKSAQTDNPDYQRGFIVHSQLQLDHLNRLSNRLNVALKVAAIKADMRKREVQA
ncbi:hypothetical protein [Thiothrix sp.]|jgi:hypothetical protein|uniref:hypothetical protein n=1 Tax=Thiothrix sp. TaxID=1032 RepID=UPI00257AB1CF|nr:hypothetical protein [Thiothrix sp.]